MIFPLTVVGPSRSLQEPGIRAQRESCALPNLQALDASVLPYVDPNYDPMKNCKPSFVPSTRVRNGRVEVVPGAEFGVPDCEFRFVDGFHACQGLAVCRSTLLRPL